MKARFTYDPRKRPSATDRAACAVGQSHRGSRVETHAAAAMRQPYNPDNRELSNNPTAKAYPSKPFPEMQPWHASAVYECRL